MPQLRGIFYNTLPGMCSIYSSGLHVYNTIKTKNSVYTLEYSENQGNLDMTADFIIVNYHFTTCRWITNDMIQKYKKPTFCIVTEVYFESENPCELSPQMFDHYIVLDPTIKETKRFHAFPRPLPFVIYDNKIDMDVTCPIIGSFGFATAGKNWLGIVKATENEYDSALIRINIPFATHLPDNISKITAIREMVFAARTKPGIQIEFTHIEMSEEELVKWCSQNTINVFLYDRDDIYKAGLSAVTDQAIASGRPLLITKQKTFRHILQYIQPYPEIDMKTAIRSTGEQVRLLQQKWSMTTFQAKFSKILETHQHKKIL